MNDTQKYREFSMKYCAGLDDHVIVMTTEQGGLKNTLCLSSHLCYADERKRCGQGEPFHAVAMESNYVKI